MFYFKIQEICSILCIFGKTWLCLVWYDFNLTYYSSIILGSLSILLFPKLCWHIGLTPINKETMASQKLNQIIKCLSMVPQLLQLLAGTNVLTP